MGPLLIELSQEFVELGLLLKAVHGGFAGRLLLERAMHAVVAAVLLGMAGLDAFDGDGRV